MQAANLECFHYAFTGNCFNRKECTRSHPAVQLKLKKKLKFDVKNDFVPDKNAIKQIVVQAPKLQVCSCCKGNPYGCKASEMCLFFGKCVCISQKEMEEQIVNSVNKKPQVKTNCDCCKGNPDNCQTVLCKQLGMCQCQMRAEMEAEPDPLDDGEVFVAEYADCTCCCGYIYDCENPFCQQTNVCGCTL